MEKYLTVFIAVLIAANVQAQQNDTITVDEPSRVSIVRNESSQNIIIDGSRENPDFHYEQAIEIGDTTRIDIAKSNSNRTALGLNFDIIENKTQGWGELGFYLKPDLEIGFIRPLNGSNGMDTRFWKSYEVSMKFLEIRVTPKSAQWWISMKYGLGFSLHDIAGGMMTPVNSGITTIQPYPAGSSNQHTSMSLLTEGIDLTGYYKIGTSSCIGLGFVWEQPIHATSSYHTSFNDETGTHSISGKPSELKDNRFGMKVIYSFAGLGLYAKYMPTKLFDNPLCPQTSTLSFGVKLNF